MLNKRAGTLLALFLAGSMVLSGPAVVLASSGDGGKASQTESEESESTEAAKDKDDSKKVKKEKEKKQTSGNGISSEDVSSGHVSSASTDKLSSDEESEEEAVQSENTEKNLPRAGVSDNGTGTFTISGNGVSLNESDYSYDGSTGVLTIQTNKAMTITGTVSSGSLRVNSAQGANLTFEDLHITGTPALNVASGTGKVQIHLEKQNTLSSIQIQNTAGVKLDGAGILSSSSQVSGSPVVISGGNIQTTFGSQPVNESDVFLYPVSVNGLSKDDPYTIANLKAGNPQATYSYGDSILADSNGSIVMYLPAGDVQVTLGSYNYEGTVVSTNSSSELHRINPTVSPTATDIPNITNIPNPGNTETPDPNGTVTPTARPTDAPSPSMQAQPADNGLYWINEGATYRSGATLQFYATGAGYGPEEPQEMDPVDGATRYVPVSWSVGNETGSWKKSDREETVGQTTSGNYVAGEYRFKGSFTLSTTGTSSVPYTLRVSYQRESYNASKDKWTSDGAGTIATKSVSFYIRNLTATATPTRSAYSSTYSRTATTSAARSSVSSNARNASTMDNTPIGILVFLMIAAAGSGTVIFRKKRGIGSK